MSQDLQPKIDFKRIFPVEAGELAEWMKRYYHYDHLEFNSEKINDLLPPFLGQDANGRAYFVALQNKVIGYFILTYAFDFEFGGKHAMLTDLFFSEEARRTGAGTQTLGFIDSLCAVEKISTLLLQVETDNQEAQNLYQKLGFKTLTRHILTRTVKVSSP